VTKDAFKVVMTIVVMSTVSMLAAFAILFIGIEIGKAKQDAQNDPIAPCTRGYDSRYCFEVKERVK
jgi:hypothetical protein